MLVVVMTRFTSYERTVGVKETEYLYSVFLYEERKANRVLLLVKQSFAFSA